MHAVGVVIGAWLVVNASLAVALLTFAPETEAARRQLPDPLKSGSANAWLNGELGQKE